MPQGVGGCMGPSRQVTGCGLINGAVFLATTNSGGLSGCHFKVVTLCY